MKSIYFSFALIMVFSFAFSQKKSTPFDFKDNVSLTLFDTDTTEVVEVYSIQKLGKTA